MRKSFTKYQETQILANQDYKCNLCSIQFGKNIHPQYDHIDGVNSNNSLANGQAICPNCHDAKSRKQNVQRSIKDKDIGFVKRCPLCNHKTRWKDYDLKNMGFTEEDWKEVNRSEYVSANTLFMCADCKSSLKVLRLDSKAGEKKLRGKKVDDAVKHCPNCGVEYDPKIKSNTYIKCEKCKKVFGLRNTRRGAVGIIKTIKKQENKLVQKTANFTIL